MPFLKRKEKPNFEQYNIQDGRLVEPEWSFFRRTVQFMMNVQHRVLYAVIVVLLVLAIVMGVAWYAL